LFDNKQGGVNQKTHYSSDRERLSEFGKYGNTTVKQNRKHI